MCVVCCVVLYVVWQDDDEAEGARKRGRPRKDRPRKDGVTCGSSARSEKQFADLCEYKTLHGHASPLVRGSGSSFTRASEVDKKIGIFASQQRRDYKVRDVQMPA